MSIKELYDILLYYPRKNDVFWMLHKYIDYVYFKETFTLDTTCFMYNGKIILHNEIDSISLQLRDNKIIFLSNGRYKHHEIDLNIILEHIRTENIRDILK